MTRHAQNSSPNASVRGVARAWSFRRFFRAAGHLVIILASAALFASASAAAAFPAGAHGSRAADAPFHAALGDVFTPGVQALGEGALLLLGSLADIPVVDDSGAVPGDELLADFFGPAGAAPALVAKPALGFYADLPGFEGAVGALRRSTVSFRFRSETTVGHVLEISRDLAAWSVADIDPPDVVPGPDGHTTVTVVAREEFPDLVRGDPVPPLFLRLRLSP